VLYRLTRVVRTTTSEIYLAWQDEVRVGQVDLHYGPEVIQATLVLEQNLERDAIDHLVKQIDRDVVASYLQDFERDNFLVTVFRGEEVTTYSDEDHEEDDNEGLGW
jgi:hypothetical protein